MRDLERRLMALEGRSVRQKARWDMSHLSHDDLLFIEACGRVNSTADLSAPDVERLERLLLRAGRTEGSA